MKKVFPRGIRLRKPDLSVLKADFSAIYNLKDDLAKGRLISLGDSVVTAFYNAFITGIFYTGFLSMYGMSLTDVGIISFIPLLANSFCIFSGMVLSRFKRKKPVLIASKILFYFLYIVATTLMPKFVTDPSERLAWFGIILFVAHAMYALFSPGFTPWFYTFFPAENEPRTRYITYNQIISSIVSSAVLLLSGVLTDITARSGHGEAFILGMRYFAFLLVLIDVAMQACAKEYPLPEGPKLRLTDVFTLPFRYKKFKMCLLMMFYWNFVANVNSIWSYHLLNHMEFSYTLINAMSVMYTVLLIFTQPFWRKVLRTYSWIITFGVTNLLWLPTEVLCFLMTKERGFMYVPICVIQNILSVGFNLSYANILYMNLPEENSTAHIAFYTLGCNLCAFLGQVSGTWIGSLSGDGTIRFLGMDVYTVQFNTLIRVALMGALGWYMVRHWREFTPDKDIEDIEAGIAAAKRLRALPRKVRRRMR